MRWCESGVQLPGIPGSPEVGMLGPTIARVHWRLPQATVPTLHPKGSPNTPTPFHNQKNLPLEDSFALNPGDLRGRGLHRTLITWPISSLKSLTLWLRADPGPPCRPVVIYRAVNQGRAFSDPRPGGGLPLARPLPGVPEILIFFTVLLVLLVTWTLTLMGSPW